MRKVMLRKKPLLCALVFAFISLTLCLVTVNPVSAMAASDNLEYELLARNFLASQYNLKGYFYDDISVHTSTDLFDETENIVGKAVILNRDGEYDYVVINLITNQVDEFGFNEESVIEKFTADEKVYYGGALNYSVKSGNEYEDFNGTRISRSKFDTRTREFKKSANKVRNQASNPNGGIISWTDVANRNSGNSNSDWSYLSGFNWNGVTGTGLIFSSQDAFNANYNSRYGINISGTCGPTAITNLFTYFKWRGFGNALRNNSAQDTFERAMVLSKWNNGTKFSDSRNALKSLASEQGYNYDIDTYFWGTNWNAYKASINKGRPILTELKTGDWGHELFVVGYEQFTYTYQVQVLWWWETRTTDYCYLRVVDGYATSNSSRFVDYNGFYSTVNGTDFILK